MEDWNTGNGGIGTPGTEDWNTGNGALEQWEQGIGTQERGTWNTGDGVLEKRKRVNFKLIEEVSY